MVIEGNSIDGITNDEKQMLYDAVCQYMFSEAKISRSKHFAADIHEKESIKASECLKQMRASWPNIVF